MITISTVYFDERDKIEENLKSLCLKYIIEKASFVDNLKLPGNIIINSDNANLADFIESMLEKYVCELELTNYKDIRP